MKRYRTDSEYHGMEEDTEGEYVKFSDVLEERKERIEEELASFDAAKAGWNREAWEGCLRAISKGEI